MTTSAPSLSLVDTASAIPLFRWSSPDGPVVVLGLAPARPLAEDLDSATLAAVAADLLRPGWRNRARLVSPMVSQGRLHQGFSLTRETTLSVGASQWTLRALSATPLAESLDWGALARTLDTFRTLAT